MRFAVLHMEDSDKWKRGAELWRDALALDGDIWDLFEAARLGALPDKAAVGALYDGIICTGSHYNLSDRATRELPWVVATAALLRSIAAMAASGARSPRVVGGCFGCQLIGWALGGEVERNPGRHFFLRAEAVVPTRALAAAPAAAGLFFLSPVDGAADGGSGGAAVLDLPDDNPPGVGPRLHVDLLTSPCVSPAPDSRSTASPTASASPTSNSPTIPAMRVLKSHGDCVARLPPGSNLLVTSSSCVAEAFSVGGSFLAIQAHPEFELQTCIEEKIWPAVTARGALDAAEQAESRATFALPRHHGLLLTLIARFLRGADVVIGGASEINVTDGAACTATCTGGGTAVPQKVQSSA